MSESVSEADSSTDTRFFGTLDKGMLRTRVSAHLWPSHDVRRKTMLHRLCTFIFFVIVLFKIANCPDLMSLIIHAKVYGVRYLSIICCKIIISWELQAVHHLGTFAQCALHCLLFSKLNAALLVSNSSSNIKS